MLDSEDITPEMVEIASIDTSMVAPDTEGTMIGGMVPPSGKIKIYYFNGYGRAEPIRMMLAASGVPW